MKINERSLKKSEELWKEAQENILSGCQLYSKGPETHIQGVSPIYIDHGKDGHVWDVDGNEYIDYVGSWGPMIVGHAHPRVVKALQEAVERGTSTRLWMMP